MRVSALKGLEGDAVVQCRADGPGQSFHDCVVVTETPADAGFGDKAKMITETFMKLTPADIHDHEPESHFSDVQWRISFKFRLKDNPPPAAD